MPEGYTTKPQFDVPLQHPEMWFDPITELWVPKYLDANIEYRRKLLKEAEDDTILQRELMGACSRSFLYWVNTFVWTYHQEDVDPETHRSKPAEVADWPFITWPIQDSLTIRMEYCFKEGKSLLVKKSRNMGASWLCLIFLHWLWLFRDQPSEIREMSRKEGLVDGDSDSLFWKHDYINQWLPSWMCPPGVLVRGRDGRTKLHVVNEITGSTIAGEATTAVSLSGGLSKQSHVGFGQVITPVTESIVMPRSRLS